MKNSSDTRVLRNEDENRPTYDNQKDGIRHFGRKSTKVKRPDLVENLDKVYLWEKIS